MCRTVIGHVPALSEQERQEQKRRIERELYGIFASLRENVPET